MSIEIKRWTDGKVLYVAENASDIRTALEEAVAEGAKLQGAKLQGAELQYAELQYAKLQYAKLQGAKLQYAKLQGAKLQGAKLQYAKLQGAKLQGAELQYAELQYAKLQGAELQYAELQGAELQGAKLQGAKLQYAKLQGAKLQGAELQYAELQGAELQGAELQYAELQGAELQGAKLQYAKLQGAEPSDPLYPIKLDFWAVLDQAPAEVGGLRRALVEGRVDGSTYRGACACLVGTIANVRGVTVDSDELGVPCDAGRPAEVWFVPIREGDLGVDDPSKAADGEGAWRASIALGWINEWMESRRAVVAVLLGAAA
jgi:uncharacterized protein YjbI with pentapeptide repeats